MSDPTPHASRSPMEHERDAGDLTDRLRTRALMMNIMGERIAWGSETALMDEAAARIAALESEFAAAYARGIDDALDAAFKLIPDQVTVIRAAYDELKAAAIRAGKGET